MNRLTRRDKYGKPDTQKRLNVMFLDEAGRNTMDEILDRLASYEDLELTPEQIREIDRLYTSKCEEVAELQEKIEELKLEYNLKSDILKRVERSNVDFIDEIMMFRGKITDGRLIEIPCKVGDTVYLISNPINVTSYENDEEDETLKIFDCKISSITFYKTSNQIRLYWDGEFVAYYLSIEDIGRVVFLTREEAEQALQRMKGE